MKAIDLFCGAGGATRGLQLAGFHVTGVDIVPQSRYCGDKFILADALNFKDFSPFDFIWAGPVCKRYSVTQSIHRRDHPDQIAAIRRNLIASNLPYCIENVEGAPLLNSILLCGTMFGLKVFRHRLFEANFSIKVPPHYRHFFKKRRTNVRQPGNVGEFTCVAGHDFLVSEARRAMGIDWMKQSQISQAIPPAYSQFIGSQFLEGQGKERAA